MKFLFKSLRCNLKSERGFSLLELVVALGISSLAVGIAAPSFMDFNNPSQDGVLQFLAYVKNVRAKAMSTTSAYTVSVSTTNTLTATYGASCGAGTQTTDHSLTYELPEGADFTDLTWSFCFNQLGLADSNFMLSIRDEEATRNVEIMLGGAVEVH